jgi:hypothetical protein
LLLIACAYLGRAICLTWDYEQPRFEKIAQVWDERDRTIRLAKTEGHEVIEVRALDSQYLGGVTELYPRPNWVNMCAADYYQVKEIQATLPW